MAEPLVIDTVDGRVAESHDGHDAASSHDVDMDRPRTVVAKSGEMRDKNNLAYNSTRFQALTTKSDEDSDKETEELTSIAGRERGGKCFLILRVCLAIVAHSFTVSGALLVINMISKLVAVREISSDPNMAHVIGALALSSDAVARIIAGVISFRLALVLAFM